jgi:hypothetical protein
MISIQKIFKVLLFFYALNTFIGISEVSFLIAFFAVLVSISKYGLKNVLNIIMFPLLLILVGLINSFSNPNVLVLKDIYYFINPILIFLFGFYFAHRYSLEKFIKYTIQLGIILSVLYLLSYSFNSNNSSISELKDSVGVPSFIISLSLFLLAYHIKIKVKIFKNFNFYFLLLFIIIAIISLSRTFILIIIILSIFSSGYISFNRMKIKRGLVILLIFISCISFLQNINNNDRKEFIGKVTSSIEEIQPQNYTTKIDINNHWRGFEAFIGLSQYVKGSPQELLFGQGFGKSAPLGFEMPLGDSSFTEIPKFHNGYVSVILKTGILGLLILFLFFIKRIRSSVKIQKSRLHENKVKGQFSIGIILVIMFSTFVISGWLNQGTITYFIFSLGFMSNYKSKLIYNANK